jgi:hypothetical protein
MGMIVFMTDQHALTSPPHSMLSIVLLQTLQTCKNRRVLLRLAILGSKCIVAEGVEADGLRLIRVEILGKGRRIRAL